MTATYDIGVLSGLDGHRAATGRWSGYCGERGHEVLEHRLDLDSLVDGSCRSEAAP